MIFVMIFVIIFFQLNRAPVISIFQPVCDPHSLVTGPDDQYVAKPKLDGHTAHLE